MRFTYIETMTDPSFYLPLAKAAEEAGYDTMALADSIFYPKESDTEYPYNGTGDRTFLEDTPFLEPFSLVTAMGAVTTRLKFVTFVVKLTIRHPILVAKQLATIAVLTDNRFALGAGTSPWPEDYRGLQVPFEKRGGRMNEMIEIIRDLLAGGYVEYHGQHFDFPALKMAPVPTEPVPILIGGHGELALKRAARTGDGWMFAGTDAEELARCLKRLQELREEHGTLDQPFQIHAASLDGYNPETIDTVAELGITDLLVGFRDPYTTVGGDTEPLEKKLENLHWYADEVIAKYRS